MPTIRRIAQSLEQWAPPASAQNYDNVGLQVGRADAEVRRAVLALDLTHEVLNEAIEAGAELIVTHHPLIFQPLKQITGSGYANNLALRLAESGIALYSIHTNLDAAPGGVSFALAERLGVSEPTFLALMDDAACKLVTFVPEDHAEAVHMAMADAGGGRIGNYDACAFRTHGTGTFRPGTDTDPHIGTAGGELETVEEIRLEMEVTQWALPAVRAAMHEAHPYEEVAHDVYPLNQSTTQAGMGAIGMLDEVMPLSAFLARVSRQLDAESLRYAGTPDAPVERVAVCGGAGSSLVGAAQGAGADAYVTADVKYHDFFRVLGADTGTPQMAFIDAGHYETEALTEDLLRNWLAERFPSITWQRTSHRTSPMRTFVDDAG
ncbi:Nif3-like dinuclear metal center hexameric protein [Longimonas halophila]|uniref:GTP cyclohydrolase 1 type 2 homolog n=1 Tax=Longimonas halophila TaxID=1469170 RepID=A0A2H3NV97_9BACT|nr:Nif3-like dinuclear metal center hexameric protein [Longimonas halophila]PEN05678.1 Nif3-like dinuclear metal center hexameric protein [Longimonas halophila]